MEADWEVEVGPGLPVIDVFWPGWVDLRIAPDAIARIPEAERLPALARALQGLNTCESQIWTSKCDLWTLEDSGALDPDEMDATPAEAAKGIACYIDCLPRQGTLFRGLDVAERWTRGAVAKLRSASGPCSRIDLVIRRVIAEEIRGFGVTAYISGCGMDVEAAELALGRALDIFARALDDEPILQ